MPCASQVNSLRPKFIDSNKERSSLNISEDFFLYHIQISQQCWISEQNQQSQTEKELGQKLSTIPAG